MRRIRSHWPTTRLIIRGDGHYSRPDVMAWCEANDVDYVFGLPGNGMLSRLVEIAADDVRVRRAEAQAAVLRRYTETRYGAKSWGGERRVAARIEASTQGLDIRYVVTNLDGGSAEWLYDTLYCARGQAENLIQAAQEPTCLRSGQLSLGTRGASRAAYRRLLADADGARHHRQAASARQRRVHQPADAPRQNRRTHHRDRHTRPRRLCRSMPGPRIVSPHRHQPPARRTVTQRVLRPRTHPVPPTPNTVMNLTDFAMKQATCSNAPARQTAPSTSMR